MIKLINVTKEYLKPTKSLIPFSNKGSIKAVDNISFSCSPSKIFTLLGPNGAGKTTTLRMIATILKPTSGEIKVCNNDVLDSPEIVRKKIGFLTGNTGLYDRLTPNEMIDYFARLNQIDEQKLFQNKLELFDLLEINEFKNQRIGTLSTGMKQKVSIARTIIHDPDVIIFDEPTSGLDILTAKNILELIKSCKEKGKTVIFSTHRMSEVRMLAEDLAIIHKGKMLFNNTFQHFISEYSEDFENEFLKLMEANN
ncbi:MAG: ATP-binding cassette domain-containing protein [Candidatus Marinimicrobia bacterium]|nr:ATP-binding cassette domain-containing protein [Candidatus Neomarinimicrobiota bacterium]